MRVKPRLDRRTPSRPQTSCKSGKWQLDLNSATLATAVDCRIPCSSWQLRRTLFEPTAFESKLFVACLCGELFLFCGKKLTTAMNFSLGDKTAIELFVGGVRDWNAGLRRILSQFAG
jgi:hypothetical protein